MSQAFFESDWVMFSSSSLSTLPPAFLFSGMCSASRPLSYSLSGERQMRRWLGLAKIKAAKKKRFVHNLSHRIVIRDRSAFVAVSAAAAPERIEPLADRQCVGSLTCTAIFEPIIGGSLAFLIQSDASQPCHHVGEMAAVDCHPP
jgi:hypothetical protein